MSKRNDTREKFIVGAIAAVILIAVFAVIVLLGGLLTALIWNVGIVAVVAACGGTVGKISLGVAILLNLALGTIGHVLRGSPSLRK